MLFERTAIVAFAVAAVNLAVFAVLGGYDWRLGPVHLVASNGFKPVLYLNAALLLVLAARGRTPPPLPSTPLATGPLLSPGYCALAVALTVAVYWPSFLINLSFFDWNHTFITGRESPWGFFIHRQYDGFYRPLPFLTLWIDNKLFGEREYLFHIQNLLLHVANTLLAGRLAERLGLTARSARICGLLFCTTPVAFEAVIWPGARFDLMAIAFSLVALERALAGRLPVAVAAFVGAVLSKESAYALPVVLAAFWILHSRLNLPFARERAFRAFMAFGAAACLLIALRFVIYGGSFGGYPGPAYNENVHFQFTTQTITSFLTRVPASAYIVNAISGMDVATRVVLFAYAAVASAIVAAGASLAGRGVLILLPWLTAIPTLNMIGWMTDGAQQARYVHLSAIWVVFALALALSGLPRERLLATALSVVFAATAILNTVAYVHMLRSADEAVASAAAVCRDRNCCRVWLRDLPRDRFGAFYFGHQVWADLRKTLPNREVPDLLSVPVKAQSCDLTLHWDRSTGKWK